MRLILSLGLIFFATGCIRIEHPLSDSATVVTDEGLVGKWELQYPIFPGDETRYVEFLAAEGGGYVWSDFPKKGEPAKAKLLDVDGTSFLEVEIEISRDEGSLSNNATDDKGHASEPVHIPFLIERKGDWLALSCLNLPKVRDYVANGTELSGKIKESGLFNEITITSSASDFGKCLVRHPKVLFTERQVYRRITSDQPYLGR